MKEKKKKVQSHVTGSAKMLNVCVQYAQPDYYTFLTLLTVTNSEHFNVKPSFQLQTIKRSKPWKATDKKISNMGENAAQKKKQSNMGEKSYY